MSAFFRPSTESVFLRSTILRKARVGWAEQNLAREFNPFLWHTMPASRPTRCALHPPAAMTIMIGIDAFGWAFWFRKCCRPPSGDLWVRTSYDLYRCPRDVWWTVQGHFDTNVEKSAPTFARHWKPGLDLRSDKRKFAKAFRVYVVSELEWMNEQFKSDR